MPQTRKTRHPCLVPIADSLVFKHVLGPQHHQQLHTQQWSVRVENKVHTPICKPTFSMLEASSLLLPSPPGPGNAGQWMDASLDLFHSGVQCLLQMPRSITEMERSHGAGRRAANMWAPHRRKMGQEEHRIRKTKLKKSSVVDT